MTDEAMRQAQIEQAARIAADLHARFPALEISGQAYAEPTDYIPGEGKKPPKYVAIYVTLVPGTVRMVILMSGAGRNEHGYQLRGMAERKAEADSFREFMQRNHTDIEIRKEDSYCPYARVPVWQEGKGKENLRVKNDNFEEIARNVIVGLAFVASVPTPRWDA